MFITNPNIITSYIDLKFYNFILIRKSTKEIKRIYFYYNKYGSKIYLSRNTFLLILQDYFYLYRF